MSAVSQNPQTMTETQLSSVATQTMQAVIRTEYGSADVLRMGEVPRPEIGENEVLVRVRAAGLERGTWHLMTGRPYLMRLFGFGVRRPKNPVLGMEVAGTVAAVGSGVKRFKVGDEVFGISQGSFAEYARAREEKLAHKPKNLSFEQSAVVGISALTALQSVRDAAKVSAGQQVLILGASGGVGTYAVQIAKALGARVTGVCSAAKRDLVRKIGADEVLDYAGTDVLDGSRKWDAILDIGGNRPLAQLRKALTPTGTIVFVGGEHGGELFGGMGRPVGASLLAMFVRQKFVMFMTREHHSDLERMAELVEAGKVSPVLDQTYSLAQVPEAMRQLEAGRVRGKIAITVSRAS